MAILVHQLSQLNNEVIPLDRPKASYPARFYREGLNSFALLHDSAELMSMSIRSSDPNLTARVDSISNVDRDSTLDARACTDIG